jgi:type III secretion protein Q
MVLSSRAASRHSSAVQPLSLTALLPRVSAACARAQGTLLRRRQVWPFALSQQTAHLRWRANVSAVSNRYGFRLGPHKGSLWIDDALNARLCGSEACDAAVPQALRTVLLADALHPLVDAVGRALRLALSWDDDAQAPPACAPAHTSLGFEIAWPDEVARGALAFDDDAGWGALLRAWPAKGSTESEPNALDDLRLPIPFTLGSTTLSLREMRSIEVGDIVRVDRWATQAGAFRVEATLPGLPQICLVGLAQGRQITFERWDLRTMNKTSQPPADAPAAARALPQYDLQRNAARTMAPGLDQMEVTLRFEVGEVILSLAELKALAPGEVLSLEKPLDECEVQILAHGNLLGQGQLIAVGDKLGVRIARFVQREAE